MEEDEPILVNDIFLSGAGQQIKSTHIKVVKFDIVQEQVEFNKAWKKKLKEFEMILTAIRQSLGRVTTV
jgi:hypothetical protein